MDSVPVPPLSVRLAVPLFPPLQLTSVVIAVAVGLPHTFIHAESEPLQIVGGLEN